MKLAVVELGQIVEVIWVSLLAGVGITTAFSLVVYGTARSAEARRAKRTAPAVAFGALAALFLALSVVALAFGVQVMLTKPT